MYYFFLGWHMWWILSCLAVGCALEFPGLHFSNITSAQLAHEKWEVIFHYDMDVVLQHQDELRGQLRGIPAAMEVFNKSYYEHLYQWDMAHIQTWKSHIFYLIHEI